jgi:hypothetical protein
MEDRNSQTEMDDITLRRTNPPCYDKRKDWNRMLGENAEDTDVSNRYDTTSLTSGASWRQTFASDENLDVPPGFIPTDKGMFTPEDLVDELSYSNYAYNRDISPDRGSDIWKKMYNYGLDPLNSRDQIIIGKNNKKVDAMERRYQKELSLGRVKNKRPDWMD